MKKWNDGLDTKDQWRQYRVALDSLADKGTRVPLQETVLTSAKRKVMIRCLYYSPLDPKNNMSCRPTFTQVYPWHQNFRKDLSRRWLGES